MVIYSTCFVEYNNSDIGVAAKNVLEKNGVEVEVAYSECCGMPQLEGGKLESVSEKAKSISSELVQWIDRGYDIVVCILLRSVSPLWIHD